MEKKGGSHRRAEKSFFKMANKFVMSLTGLHGVPLAGAFLLLFLYSFVCVSEEFQASVPTRKTKPF